MMSSRDYVDKLDAMVLYDEDEEMSSSRDDDDEQLELDEMEQRLVLYDEDDDFILDAGADIPLRRQEDEHVVVEALDLMVLPGGQPMQPPTAGDTERPWLMPDIVVKVRRPEEESSVGVIREVLPDLSCWVHLESNGRKIIAVPHEMEMVVPRDWDKVKVIGGAQRGATGNFLGKYRTNGIVEFGATHDVKLIPFVNLAKAKLG